MHKLLLAIMLVESGGRDNAVGDRGKAVGALQIHKEVVADVNRVYGTHFTWPASCFSRKDSFDIAEKYLLIYAPRATAFEKARVWNGGPRGHLKPQTISYANKVKDKLK